MAREPPVELAPGSALARLLETEAQLELMLAESTARAHATVASAEQDALTTLAAVDDELAQLGQDVAARYRTELVTRIAQLEADAARELHALESVGPDRIVRLTDWVIEQVIAGGGRT
jgi:electron transfer flavoprotein alpha/beta subunit